MTAAHDARSRKRLLRRGRRIVVLATALGLVWLLSQGSDARLRERPPARSQDGPAGANATSGVPRDTRAQAAEYIGYYHSIALTPEQERTKRAALSDIPAPCCANYSAATCCCPCNLAKSVWGLSHYLLAKQDADREELKKAVAAWIHSTNEAG